jgi:hypothetical protein
MEATEGVLEAMASEQHKETSDSWTAPDHHAGSYGRKVVV